MTYDDAMAMFPNPRGGRGDAMDRHASVLRTRFIPLLFVVIWGITLLMVLGGLEWILIADPTPPGSGSAGG